MNRIQVDYDGLAVDYDRRFVFSQDADTGQNLQHLVGQLHAQRILEAGCGTGHWLERLSAPGLGLFGLDLSSGMLAQAQRKIIPAHFVQGAARQLPFKEEKFDLVYCVNALHHFADPTVFIGEAHRILAVGGLLAIIGGSKPRSRSDWYIYQYFKGCYELDEQRFPAWSEVSGWFEGNGFTDLKLIDVAVINESKLGREVFKDPFLEKHACSQLALLPQESYQEGLLKIEKDLSKAETDGRILAFRTWISIKMLSGMKNYPV